MNLDLDSGICNRLQVKKQQACITLFIIIVQRHEAILQIKRNGICISIYRQEAAAGLVVCNEETFIVLPYFIQYGKGST